MELDDVGIPAAEKRDGMRFLESKRLWLTSPADHPFRVEWLWYGPGSSEVELVPGVRAAPIYVAVGVASSAEGMATVVRSRCDSRAAVKMRWVAAASSGVAQ